MLLGLRNVVATINIFLWWEVLQVYNFATDTKSNLTEATVGNLVWHIFIFVLTPPAIAIKIFALFIIMLQRTASIKLA